MKRPAQPEELALAYPWRWPCVVAGAAVGGAAGGIIGALTDSGVSEQDANAYAEGFAVAARW